MEVCHGFNYEQELIFLNKLRALIENGDLDIWVVAYTERVVRLCEGLLFSTYNEYCLWYVPLGTNSFAQQLGMSI